MSRASSLEVQEADVKPNRVTRSILLKRYGGVLRRRLRVTASGLGASMPTLRNEDSRQYRYAYLGHRIRKPELLSTKSGQLKISWGTAVTGSQMFGGLSDANQEKRPGRQNTAIGRRQNTAIGRRQNSPAELRKGCSNAPCNPHPM
jgi:hypothetical protein